MRRLSPVTLGMALGLFCSAFARTEFQAVQFVPAVVFPQMLLCGLLVPRDQMVTALRWVVRDGNRLLRVNGSDGHPWFLVTFGGPCQIVPGEPSPRQYLPPVTGPPTDCPGFPAEGFAPSLQSESEAIGAARKALRDAGLGPAHLQATRGAVSWHVEALPVADPARRWTASIGADGHIVDASGFLGTA